MWSAPIDALIVNQSRFPCCVWLWSLNLYIIINRTTFVNVRSSLLVNISHEDCLTSQPRARYSFSCNCSLNFLNIYVTQQPSIFTSSIRKHTWHKSDKWGLIASSSLEIIARSLMQWQFAHSILFELATMSSSVINFHAKLVLVNHWSSWNNQEALLIEPDFSGRLI